MNAPVIAEACGDPWSIPIDQIDVSDSRLFQDDIWPDWFARLRRDDPVHYTADSQFGPYWSVTKYKDIMKVETDPQRLLLGVRDHSAGSGDAIPAGDVHRHGPAEARRAAPGRGADRRPRQSRHHGRHDPGARDQNPRRLAAQRNLRLGRACVDRTDHADAGDVVRLPVRAAAGPDLLVEHRHDQFQGPQRAGQNRGRAVQRAEEDGRRDDGVVE